MTSPLRIIFAGTPDFAAAHLACLLNKPQYELLAVYTQPDRPAGRGKQLSPSPVKRLALEHQLTVEQPLNFKEPEALEKLVSYKADLMIVVAYGIILPQAVLDAPRFGCINVHASLLPRWRGAAPIQRAIETGDEQTGITIMQMEAGLDTGPMLAKQVCEIGKQETGTSLHDHLITLGEPLLLQVLENLESSFKNAEVQNDDEACYAHKITKAQAELDWQQSAVTLAQKVRAFNPFPVCFFKHQGLQIRVWQAEATQDINHRAKAGEIISADKAGINVACREGVLQLQVLQLPGKKALPVSDILNAQAAIFAKGVLLNTVS